MAFNLGIVNYHYIREEFSNSGVFGITPNEFKAQLIQIWKNGFEFISLENLQQAIINRSTSALPRKSCLVTFDDGLRESYDIGKRILDEMSIPAGYFISTGILENKRILNVHALHLIQQHLSYEEICKVMGKDYLGQIHKVQESIIAKQYPWDNLKVSTIKYLFNFLLRDEYKREFVEIMLKHLGIDENRLCRDLYMDISQVRILSELGWLGSHGVTHAPLTALNSNELVDELQESKIKLSEFGFGEIKSIAYPYGGNSSINTEVTESVEEAGYKCGLSMIRGFNSESTLMETPLMLHRFDTNDFYGGKSHSSYIELFHEIN